jgi:hypothetical protein
LIQAIWLSARRLATPERGNGLKKITRSCIAPFNQRQKLDLPSQTFRARSWQARGKQLIHLRFDGRPLATPMLKCIALLHVTSPKVCR